MAIEQVKAYFRSFNMDDRIMEFDVSSATVDLAAQALHCVPARIAKTLAFKTTEGPVLIVTSGDTRIDNEKYKSCFGEKAHMLHGSEVETLIGHGIGGVCPFAVNSGVKVYLDTSMKRFDTVYPACGSANSAIEMTMEELEKYAHPEAWVCICKTPET